MTTKPSAASLRGKLQEVNVAPITDDEPAPPSAEPQQQIAMTPERQMMVRIWFLEDENTRLKEENAALQAALAKATKD